jgi:predicted transcriptional regulator
MFAWILNTKPVNLGSMGSTTRSTASRGKGDGAQSASALRQAAARVQRGLSGKGYQGETLNFESPGEFFGRLTERRVERGVRRVHEDAAILAELGLIEKDENGKLHCPYADIHVDMHLRQAA